MPQQDQPISPLRQRMLDDMAMRKLSPQTQKTYIRAVNRLQQFLGHSPGKASAEDLRRFQVHLVHYGNDLEIILQGKVKVGYGLCLDPLGRIHDQQGTFTGCN